MDVDVETDHVNFRGDACQVFDLARVILADGECLIEVLPSEVVALRCCSLDDLVSAIRQEIRRDGIFLGLLGAKMAVDGTLRGAADTKVFTIANLVNLGLRILISFTLASVFGIQMVWYASPVGWFTNWLISYLHFRKTQYGRIAG